MIRITRHRLYQLINEEASRYAHEAPMTVCEMLGAVGGSPELTVSTDRSSGFSTMPTAEPQGSGLDQILTQLDMQDSLKGASVTGLIKRIIKTSDDNNNSDNKAIIKHVKKWLTSRGYGLTSAGPEGTGSVITKDWE